MSNSTEFKEIFPYPVWLPFPYQRNAQYEINGCPSALYTRKLILQGKFYDFSVIFPNPFSLK